MRRFLLLFIIAFPFVGSEAQVIESEAMIARNLISGNIDAIGLSSENLNNYIVSSTYENISSGYRMVYLQQSFRSIPVYNQMLVLAFKKGKLISKAGAFLPEFEKFANVNSGRPILAAESAVFAAISDRGLPVSANRTATEIKRSAAGDFVEYTDMGVSRQNITAQLIWTPTANSHDFHLAWQVYIIPNTTPDYWMIRVDAVDSKIIGIDNYTDYDNWGYPEIKKEKRGPYRIAMQLKANYNNIFYFNNNNNVRTNAIVSTATYRVIPFPAEAPSFPLGAHVLRTDPWLAAPGNATSLKWNTGLGGIDYDYTRGNNVWAYQDTVNDNGSSDKVTRSASSSSALPNLTFDFTPDYTINPKQSTPVQNQQFNITNLFYWNNIIHDVMYQYGFTETAGNFQDDNQGRGGLGNDHVNAEAQDGGGTNNANFSTPVDGTSGRMQMYLWSAPSLVVNSPVGIAGNYTVIESAFSSNNLLRNVGPKTGQVVYYNDDAAGNTHYACNPPANSVSGKIALIDRGFGGSICTASVSFTVKVKNAQNAGAIAVIVINNAPGDPFAMSGSDNTITIPALMISQSDGAIIAAQLANNVNVTMSWAQLDGDVDNGVIAHEYGHGISNRLTGGPANSSCLQNTEQMGEGWSDYYALMFTQDWSTATLSSGFNSPRGMGTYVKAQTPNGPGIRTQRYSTDFSINNRVYSASISTESHNRGEIWCATLWDMTWNIINQVGMINPNLYNLAGGGGNTIALNLVTEGLKLQQCSPGFISGRNAILQADQILYGGAYSCAIWEAFRRRGMGAGASEGSTLSINDQIPDYNLFTLDAIPNVTTIGQGSNIVYTNTVTTNNCSTITNYTLKDTLPVNVTYVSGGSYDALNRVVSFPVTQAAGSTGNYVFTVNVNNGSYFAPVILFDETVAGATIPATWTTTTPSGTPWTVSTTISNSSPNSFYVDNLAAAGDQRLATTTSYALPLNSYPELSFWHKYNTENGWDGGVVEISTDGGANWTDLGAQMTLNGYNSGLGPSSTNALFGRAAFTGLQSTFINTKINLSPYAGMSVMIRFRFGSDNNTSAHTSPAGWWVDDIVLNYSASVGIRTSLFNSGNVREAFKDMVSLIAGVVNDNAPGAILLTVDGGCSGSPYTNVSATQSAGEPFAACQGAAGFKTVWYRFVAPASGNVRISMDYTGGTMGADSRLALFSATNVNDYSTFTSIACNDDNGVNVPGRSILYATGLIPGNTYYIQGDGKNGSTTAGTFCLAVDNLTSSMISTSTGCISGQPLTSVNDNYTGWLSATDINGNLVALISNPSGGATTSTSTYTHSLNINSGPVRTDAISGQKYLDRNFSINNAIVTNANVRFFMLITELTALQSADHSVTLGNLQATRQTGATCNSDFVAGNGSNSSLAQTGNGSGSGFSWVQVNTPGFSKFFLHTPSVRIPVKVFLQGAFSATVAGGPRHKNLTAAWVTAMNTGAGGNALSQPYNAAPFSYTGNESKTLFPATTNTGTDILDWILVELRNGASPTTVISRRAAFVLCNGNVVDTDGVSPVRFDSVPTGNYHVAVRHRNHLAIRTSVFTNMSAALGAVAPALYDFSNAQSKAFQLVPSPTGNAAMKDTLVSGIHYFLMWGGNANGMTTAGAPVVRTTGPATINDYSFLTSPAVLPTIGSVVANKYHPADMNMDATIRATGPTVINDYSFLINTVLISLSAIITQHQ